MRTSLNWETVRSSPNSTPIVGFGRFPWMTNQNCSPPLSHSSAPEIFQRTMSKVLEGSEGTLCQMDDVLIHGVDQSEHDGRVRAVLHRLQEAGMTLNDKCEFSRSSSRFIAHIIDSSGTHAVRHSSCLLCRSAWVPELSMM